MPSNWKSKKNYPSIISGFSSVCRKTFLHVFPLSSQMEWLVRCLQKHYSPDFRQRVAKQKRSQRWEHRTYTLAIIGPIFWWKRATSVTCLSVYVETAFLTLEHGWKHLSLCFTIIWELLINCPMYFVLPSNRLIFPFSLLELVYFQWHILWQNKQ